jgi:hypothetical protein
MPPTPRILDTGLLRRLYVDRRLTARELAGAIGSTYGVVGKNLLRCGLLRPNGTHTSTLEERFREKYRVTDSGCWEWTPICTKTDTAISGPGGRSAIRYAYTTFVGPIPDGYEIDHLCRFRACVNPGHLEAVTKRENTMRGESPPARNARATHCQRGHPLSGDNVDRWRNVRVCRACRAAKGRVA